MIYFIFSVLYNFYLDETAYTGMPGETQVWFKMDNWKFTFEDSSFSVKEFYFKAGFTPWLRSFLGYKISLTMEFFSTPELSRPKVYKTIPELSLLYKRNFYERNNIYFSGKFELLLPFGLLIPVHRMPYLEDHEDFFKLGISPHLLFSFSNSLFDLNSDLYMDLLRKTVSEEGYIIYPSSETEVSLFPQFFIAPIVSGGYSQNKPFLTAGLILTPIPNFNLKLSALYSFFPSKYYSATPLTVTLTALF